MSLRAAALTTGTVAALFVFTFASSALALSAQVSAPSAPVAEDLAYTVTVTGDAGAGSKLFAKTRVTGGAPCAGAYKNDPGSDLFYAAQVTGNFTKTTSRTSSDTGTVQVCMWLQGDSGDNTAAHASTGTITVRQPNTTLTLSAPSGTGPGQPLQLTASYQAEVQRNLFVKVQPAGAAGCTSAYKNDAGSDVVYSEDIVGGPRVYTKTLTTGDPGGYLLCGYVQEDSGDETAELTTSTTFTVPKVNTSVSLRGRPIRGGYSVSGALSTRQSGSRVVIERRSGSGWRKVKSFSTGYNGAYSGYVYTKKAVKIRARFSATSYYNGSTSPTRSVRPGRRR
ncbi:MAG TPA: hypothetical protein PKD63_11925 [Solirubrobacteraceae bacterium]|nr:hypothetical protein [Solirubrobacteraceae bacterium]